MPSAGSSGFSRSRWQTVRKWWRCFHRLHVEPALRRVARGGDAGTSRKWWRCRHERHVGLLLSPCADDGSTRGMRRAPASPPFGDQSNLVSLNKIAAGVDPPGFGQRCHFQAVAELEIELAFASSAASRAAAIHQTRKRPDSPPESLREGITPAWGPDAILARFAAPETVVYGPDRSSACGLPVRPQNRFERPRRPITLAWRPQWHPVCRCNWERCRSKEQDSHHVQMMATLFGHLLRNGQ